VPSAAVRLRCQRCGFRCGLVPVFEGCPACSEGAWAANLVVEYDQRLAKSAWQRLSGRGVWRYAGLLPIASEAARVSLGEGDTALVPIHGLIRGWDRLWLKNESANPTWSYKDRQCAVAVAKALEVGSRVIAASSVGNHGASAAAYAARAGLAAVVFAREDVAPSSVSIMRWYGAEVLRTSRRGRWLLLAYGVRELGWYSVSTYTDSPTGNPYGVEGYKTIAFEIVEQLGAPPAVVVVPTAYGEGLSGIWAGFRQLSDIGVIKRLPRMVAAEPAGGGPLAHALENDLPRVNELAPYETIATSIGSTTATDAALLALRESGGTSVRVSDESLTRIQLVLARVGILLEPAAVAGLAALEHLASRSSDIDPGRNTVVVIGTAGGLRQIQALADRFTDAPTIAPETTELDRYVQQLGLRCL
jgi:threonine synthase